MLQATFHLVHVFVYLNNSTFFSLILLILHVMYNEVLFFYHLYRFFFVKLLSYRKILLVAYLVIIFRLVASLMSYSHMCLLLLES
jgi:hypothetical protein